MQFKKPRPKTFEASNINSRKKRATLLIEIFVVLILVFGVSFTFINLKNFDFSKSLKTVKRLFEFKKEQAKQRELTFEDRVKAQVDNKVLSVTDVKKTSQGVNVKSKEEVEVFISDKKDLTDQVKTLQTLLSKAKIEKREVLLVDFRFDKLVVRYK